MTNKDYIEAGKAYLGIELGSTRIKAVMIDNQGKVLASGGHGWENQLENGIWTYSLDMINTGIKSAYAELAEDVQNKYGIALKRLAGIGISAMMHGYMAFDKEENLLVPFRTWRNTITEQAADELTEVFDFNVPQRWSVSHLYQAILNKEEHVSSVAYVTTLSGYIHYLLTGKKVIGIGDASGMFPIDSETFDYDQKMVDQFDEILAGKGLSYKLREVFPEVLCAGQCAGTLTAEGAAFLDVSGNLEVGIPLCPPEGDAGTGMVATNSVAMRTGNVSAGTSIFAMIVLEKKLSKVYREIDMVTTPDGSPVAMSHANNCTSDLNAWVGL
ncbi:MAG: ATPase, partial [Lachnospiraceae bacterium]|nr:ATPase [Candidatus Equihabitans merdae]